VRARARLS